MRSEPEVQAAVVNKQLPVWIRSASVASSIIFSALVRTFFTQSHRRVIDNDDRAVGGSGSASLLAGVCVHLENVVAMELALHR